MVALATDANQSRRWGLLGVMMMLAAFLILSFYSVIAGWAIPYVGHAASGAFDGASAKEVGGIFGGLLASPGKLLLWHTVFMALTVGVSASGVKGGIERAVTILMPSLLVLLIVLIVYNWVADANSFAKALGFLFNPDFSKLTAEAVLTAIGHAFFTLSIAGGAVFAYGSYLDGGTSIARTSFAIAIIDTLVALMAGLAIFPIVFAHGLEPGAGPSLVFVTLPIAFGKMPAGQIIGALFFAMLVVAAWTSSISMLEAIVEWLQERGMGRARASVSVAGAALAARPHDGAVAQRMERVSPARLHRALRRQDPVRPLRLPHREHHAAVGRVVDGGIRRLDHGAGRHRKRACHGVGLWPVAPADPLRRADRHRRHIRRQYLVDDERNTVCRHPQWISRMKLKRLPGAFGAEITGLDLSRPMDQEIVGAIVSALYEHLVVCIRRQKLSPAEFASFGRRFGEPIVHVEKDLLVERTPEVMTLSNADGRPDRQRNGANHWHTDLVFTEKPASFTMLNAIAVPRIGGETGFADQYAAYDALPGALRRQAENLTVAHCYEGRRDGSFPTVYHPLVRAHPVTGRKALYGANSTCIGLRGMNDEAAAAILARYRDYALADSIRYYHQYEDDDVVIWDNAATLHTGPRLEPAGGDVEPRIMNRISVRGWPSVS